MKTYKSMIVISLAILLTAGCKGSEPKVHYKYLVWVDSSGYYTNGYELKDGLIYFESTHGRKIIATRFEIIEPPEGYER